MRAIVVLRDNHMPLTNPARNIIGSSDLICENAVCLSTLEDMKIPNFLTRIISSSREDRQVLANAITVDCFRNTNIENIHAGITPISKTGDFSDIYVVDAEGSKIAWKDVSRISQKEMKLLNKEISNRVFALLEDATTVHGARNLIKRLEFAMRCSIDWDLPTDKQRQFK